MLSSTDIDTSYFAFTEKGDSRVSLCFGKKTLNLNLRGNLLGNDRPFDVRLSFNLFYENYTLYSSYVLHVYTHIYTYINTYTHKFQFL